MWIGSSDFDEAPVLSNPSCKIHSASEWGTGWATWEASGVGPQKSQASWSVNGTMISRAIKFAKTSGILRLFIIDDTAYQLDQAHFNLMAPSFYHR